LLSAQVSITMEVESDFNLHGKLLGPKGQYLRNITNESGGAKVHLRGKDASPTASEADQLHLYITANSQVVLDRAKKLANDLIANVQKQYDEFKQKKAAGLLYPTMMPGFMPFMPAYPYPGYPPYGNFPPFPGRPPFPSYPPHPARGSGYPMVPGYTALEENAAGNTTTESTTPDSDKSKTQAQSSETSAESTAQPSASYDPNSYYGGYGYPTTPGYESYPYSSAYNYYPGMEQTAGDKSSGVDPSSQQVNPYGYHYPATYGDQQPYTYDMDNEQNPPQN